jgi:excisionase family DNA binding protein
MKKRENPGRTAYTTVELAGMWGCHVNTIRRLIESGQLRAFKLDREWRIPATVVEEYIARSRCFAPDPDAAAGS